METVSGKVESKSRKGNSIKVNGEWYGTFSADELAHVNWKDEVVFNYVTKGDYRNIKGKVRVSSSGGPASSASSSRGNSMLGVELGHASKLAMDATIARYSNHTSNICTPEFFKEWLKNTETVHGVMKGLRAKHENAPQEENTPVQGSEVNDMEVEAKEKDLY